MQTIKAMLGALEKSLREDVLTLANTIDDGTLICAVETTPHGTVYHQNYFEKWPESWQKVLRNQKIGYKNNNIKVVAIYHVWI